MTLQPPQGQLWNTHACTHTHTLHVCTHMHMQGLCEASPFWSKLTIINKSGEDAFFWAYTLQPCSHLTRVEISWEGRVDSKSVALIQSFLINTAGSFLAMPYHSGPTTEVYPLTLSFWSALNSLKGRKTCSQVRLVTLKTDPAASPYTGPINYFLIHLKTFFLFRFLLYGPGCPKIM